MMENSIIIEGIQCSVHCGVTSMERRQPQPIVVDLEIQCANARAAVSDDLIDTVDYGKIVGRVADIAATSRFCLLEALAERISQTLFQEFPITHLETWVRKTAPPLDHIKGSVGVRRSQSCSQTSHQQTAPNHHSELSPFFLEHSSNLRPGKILDLATGSGRHARYLAARGFSVVGIDRDEAALAQAQELAAHNTSIADHKFVTQHIDLEATPGNPPDLGKEVYDGILVFFYLFRPLFPQIIEALKPGGRLLYETFLIDNQIVHQHPRNKDFCLEHNELLKLTNGLRILHYQEGEHKSPQGKEPVFTAQLVAQKE
ncbi:MAG: hypothetical protein NPIRA04_33560 [Nitrospirales bacterium]|nr:MAG: hypothetical protein NPIRA04_33560 [Nitrospirales bacterium]